MEEGESPGLYLPHHPVQHPHKPEKVRVVFDCGAKYLGSSLNAQLLKGPDFMSSLVGVLTRFRLEKVAIVGDVEQMFHQMYVDPKDRKYLRFLWWPDGDLNVKPVAYQMNVHLFGATSSPGCAQFALLQSAEDQVDKFEEPVRHLLRKNFYMDDCLFSAPSVEKDISLVQELSALLQNRGFNLTKWVSNNSLILQSIPTEKHARSAVELKGEEGYERGLGVHWNLVDDCFKFRVRLPDKPITRRGM